MPQHNLSHRYEKMKYSQFYRNVPTFDWLCMMMLIIELCALLEERERPKILEKPDMFFLGCLETLLRMFGMRRLNNATSILLPFNFKI